jgi:ribonucleoside-diphosphate reductase alpha chain
VSGGSRTTGSTRRQRGLRLERVFTRPGVHPYDEVTWERRDVVMTNWRDGSINFEQRGVEFPETWSVNAANIVTTKYFRGAVGTEQRETSLRQLIDRVVQTYRRAGEENGYFARAHPHAAAPGVQLQLTGVVQRRHVVPPAGLSVFHPRC